MTSATERLTEALKDRYRVERQLGEGGMATVFLAEDVRHHRKVAIKVLHAELSAVIGSERFLKEIELTANLQHPHILPLFDSGSADGLLYYVMPYVEGETLRGRLTRERQLPLGDALRIANDVADALDYAHKRHVIHRDIKPENILLLDGRPLVADFGIALAVEQAAGSRMTQTGMSLGTPQYMAPEQAMGDKSVDHRADIYALGAVVFEMLAGEPPFTGPTAQAIVAKVMTERPRSLTSIRDTVSPQIAAAVTSALQKLPADRPATATEFAKALSGSSATPTFEFVPAPRWSTGSIVGGIALTALLFGIAGYSLGYRTHRDVDTSGASRLAMLAPNLGGTGGAALRRQIALTPDGNAVVYVAQSAGNSVVQNVLAYQRLDSETPAVIPGSDAVLDPVISPDGKTVYGYSNPATGATASNVKLPITGGSPTQLPREINTAFAKVTADGSIWYSQEATGDIRKVGENEAITTVVKGTQRLRLQQILPGKQKALVVQAGMGTTSGPAGILDMKSGKVTPLTEVPVVEARYGAGHLTYAMTDGTLWAAPLDPGSGKMTAPAVRIGSNVSLTGTGIAQFAMAPNGTVAYVPEEPRSLVLIDRDGRMRTVEAERRNYHSPRFSPDGTRISVDFSGADGRDVWILSLARGTLTRATFDRDGHDASWTPDGRYITYTSFKTRQLGLYRTRPGGGGGSELLSSERTLSYTGDWLPDGRSLVTTITLEGQTVSTGIGLIENAGKGPVRKLIADQFDAAYPAVSPDGRWLAFVSTKSGNAEIYVRPFDKPGEEVQVSQGGGNEPVWSRDGRELYYRGSPAGNSSLVAVTARTAPTFDVVSTKNLFPITEFAAAVPHASYDISPDGRTFVFVRRSLATRIMVIQKLPALVKSLRGASSQNQ